MTGISRTLSLAGLALLLAGCRNTEYPSLAPSGVSQKSVNRSFAYHDPNPDTDAGPWVERPRGFERPRATPQRVEERYEKTRELMQRDGAPMGNNPSASRYPDSVSP